MIERKIAIVLAILSAIGASLISYSAFLLLTISEQEQGPAEADFSGERITIPVRAHLIHDESGFYTSSRDAENILELFEEVNRIWEQADIEFRVREIVITGISGGAVPNALNGNYSELYGHEAYAEDRVNVFFAQSLNGINGLAIPGIKSALIADRTTVSDYRTTAHELAHVLGLKHTRDDDKLLARGKNGETLSISEIMVAREHAFSLIQIVS